MNRLCTLVLVVALSAITPGYAQTQESPNAEAGSAVTLRDIQGVWLEPGSGLALEVEQHAVNAYHFTRQTCVVIKRFAGHDEAQTLFTRIQREAVNWVSFIPSGGTEFYRIRMTGSVLPPACKNPGPQNEFEPEFIFAHTWHALNDYYPFFKQRGVDWHRQYRHYRPQVTAASSPEALFQIISEMLDPLDDGHVGLEVDTENFSAEFSANEPVGWELPAIALAKEEGITYEESLQSIQQTFVDNLFTHYADVDYSSFIDEEGRQLLVWGRLKGNVGYIQLNALQGYAEEDELQFSNAQQDLILFSHLLDQVIRDMQSTTGLIVDLRFNAGGSDELALEFANRFADTSRLAFTKHNYNSGQPALAKQVMLKPNAKRTYLRPVHIMMGPNTASAAEVLAMSTQVLPHVNLIGQNTSGILSDAIDFTLNSGWTLTFPYQEYFSAAGRQYETIGVPPQQRGPVSSFTALEFSAFPLITDALNKLGVKTAITQQAFELQVNNIMREAGIPALSVTWVDDDSVMKSVAYGYADLEGGVKNTVNTPFYVGSVSKTVVGVVAAQMQQRGVIRLSTRLDQVELPFSVDSPYFDAGSITLQQLLSHNAGIVDNVGYVCSYYQREDKASLGNLFLGLPLCPEPSISQQPKFLAAYFASNGVLYNADNFLKQGNGEFYQYTNVGAALAAQMLSSASERSIDEWSEQYIFKPLGMQATHWHASEYPADAVQPAKRYLFTEGQIEAVPDYALASWADGGLISSANDLAGYLLMVVNEGEWDDAEILSENSVEQMLRAQTAYPITEGQQGMLWTRDEFMFGHDGGDPGVLAQLRYDQYNEFGFALTLNLTDSRGDLSPRQAEKYDAAIDRLMYLVYQRGLSLRNNE